DPRPAAALRAGAGLRRRDVCGDGRLRPRPGRAVPAGARRRRPRRDDELDRADLGRQRDLAGPGRHALDRGVSRRLRHPAAGLLRAAGGDAVRAHLPRHRLRVPLPRPALPLPVGLGLHRRLGIGRVLPGPVLGGLIDGVPVEHERFVGGAFGFISGFAVVSGLGVVAGYTLLGASWLILKTGGSTGEFGRRAARPALLVTLAFIAVISVWTPLKHPQIWQRWFSLPNFLFLWPVPFVTALAAWAIWRSIRSHYEWVPFLFSIALFLLALSGLGISLFPYAVPWQVTIWQAASSTPT